MDLFGAKKEYETWDEAFRGLTPLARQQSVRVAAYTQVIFLQACTDGFGKEAKGGADRMQRQYADAAYKCGMYHQLGKALVPAEYQVWRDSFTEEEKNIYKSYTTDGRLLVASLQDKGVRKVRGKMVEQPTKSIPALMIRESCEQHMERWDGTGYPDSRYGSDISPVAQIVGLAKELDRLASETKSEDPFEDALAVLTAQAGRLWSASLIEVLKNCKDKCFEIFDKYIHYTRAIPKTIPLVQRRPERPMGLAYQPMVQGVDNEVAAYEAFPWFGGVEDQPEARETVADVEAMLQRTNLVGEMSFYFLYEATDAILRMNNCKLDLQGVLLNMIPSFYQMESQLERLLQVFEDQNVSKRQLMLTIPESVVTDANVVAKEVIRHYNHNGIRLVLDGYHPEVTSDEVLKELEFTCVRFAPELHLQQQTVAKMQELQEQGMTIIGGGADSQDVLTWLAVRGVACASGALTGGPVDEDQMIRDCLAREN